MKTYLYDLHIHTKEASHCGRVPAVEAAKRYKSIGYDGIVITDHMNFDTFRRYEGNSYSEKVDRWLSGYRAAKAVETEDFHIILGMEFRARENNNDYLVYGFDEDFVKNNDVTGLETIEDFVKIARENNLVVFQAHPFRDGITVVEPSLLDGIEIYNGHKDHDSRNDIALLWAEKFNMRKISGSDFHGNLRGTPGGVRFYENPKTSEDLAKMLLSGEYIIATMEK